MDSAPNSVAQTSRTATNNLEHILAASMGISLRGVYPGVSEGGQALLQLKKEDGGVSIT
jgi:hypothetical protein